jgi:glycosyltransferase involved in cell wall biosynthesis
MNNREKKLVSIVSPTFNEEGNVEELYDRIVLAMKDSLYDFEVIVIDNASSDQTVSKLKTIAGSDSRLKLILNASNFGHIRSPYYGLLQAKGDAVIGIASDLQDPPEMIPELLKMWEQGSDVILAVKSTSDEGFVLKKLRKTYYSLLNKISDSPMVQNATGAGLFDQKVLVELRKLQDPYPYFRGLVTELGFPVSTMEFHQPLRKAGKSKNNFFTLYDMAILGITTHSRVPMRLISLFGLFLAFLSFAVAIGYGVAKLLFWDSFDLGLAPILFGVFFFGSVQLFLIGLMGEYLSSIQTRIRKLPLVIEKDRINF